MNSKSLTSQRDSFQARVSLLLVALIVSALAGFLPFVGASSPPFSLPQDNQSSQNEERELGVGLPKHVPLKIKAKNIKSKKWAHDLEIEVTNISNKPIYYLSFMVVMQGIKSPEGKEYMFWVHYGRGQLNDFSTKLESTDIPLMPNESYVLKIDQPQADGWEKTRSKLNKPQPSKVGLVFQMLNFGDGTGYGNAQGRFFDINRKVELDQKCLSPPKQLIAGNQSALFLPAAYEPVNFFSRVAARQPCCDSGCDYVKQSFYTCTQECNPNNPDKPTYTALNCGSPGGACHKIEQGVDACWSGESYISCTIYTLYDCCALCGAEGIDQATCHDGFDNDGDGFIDCAEPNCAFLAIGGEASCDDGIDNDCDGGTDCADTDCWDTCIDFETGCTLNQKKFCEDMQTFCFQGSCYTPILIDTAGDGYKLTNPTNGVLFDLGTGQPYRIAWTVVNDDDGWLVLDRNDNGQIDSGRELFGNMTEQPESAERHGFKALAVFDTTSRGGNGDGLIDQRDAIFPSLRVWRDTNHNATSESSELQTLLALDIAAIDLDFKESKKTDEYGNRFRYRAKIYDVNRSRLSRWAWDVFLRMAP